jgi:hypothetical protein
MKTYYVACFFFCCGNFDGGLCFALYALSYLVAKLVIVEMYGCVELVP